MANINQTIIVRTDLFNLPEDTGLLAAQVAHIHAKVFTENLSRPQSSHFVLPNNIVPEDFVAWVKEPYLLVKKVPNAEALKHFRDLADKINLPIYEWYDTVYVRLSETMKQAFEMVLVGISIGPADADRIRTVVGDLPLL